MSRDVYPGIQTPDCKCLTLTYYCRAGKGVSGFENKELRGSEILLELSLKGEQNLPTDKGVEEEGDRTSSDKKEGIINTKSWKPKQERMSLVE